MWMRRAFPVVLASSLLLTAGGAIARTGPPGQPLQADHAYIVTQQHRDNLSWWNGTWTPQTVPSGAHIQVQLPSNPIRWEPDLSSDCQPSAVGGVVSTAPLPSLATALFESTDTLPNPGRLPGSSEISVFDYRVSGYGQVALCLRPQPVPADPARVGAPEGTPADYVVTLNVGAPQLSVP